MMENSTLQNVTFQELLRKSKSLRRLLYLVAAAAMISLFAMPLAIIVTSGAGIINLALGAVAIGLTFYLYKLSIRDSKMHQELWKRRFGTE
ncbi:hypothetical protein [Jiulongibacter sp. NS-SX5]|uniref:hypothetical protein n=1 Tax=Jiulongibacter sp. NS-SX5 TaxID=3463854 RepID=UPI00405A3ECC